MQLNLTVKAAIIVALGSFSFLTGTQGAGASPPVSKKCAEP